MPWDAERSVTVPPGSREAWRRAREAMEAAEQRFAPEGPWRERHWWLARRLIWLSGLGLRLAGLYGRGRRNALDVRLTRLELGFERLPAAFDGFTILQLSDLHADFLPEAFEAALGHLDRQACDLCVLTGDYRRRITGGFEEVLPAIRALVSRASAVHGITAILGNHDTGRMVEAFEDLGIRFLLNEAQTVRRGDSAIHLIGTDDVHYYYTDQARRALEAAPEGFRIALVHSAELADAAAAAGFDLYLAGHTHGGQVCLPSGRPLVTRMTRLRRYASGRWRHGEMTGYTSTGVGASLLPVRFNTRGEVVHITLRRRASRDPAREGREPSAPWTPNGDT
jgi:predicted MPP superfamily phosphohydrolase